MIVAEVGVFSAATMAMGLIGARRSRRTRSGLQIVSIAFMVPLGLGPGGDGQGRPRLRRAQRPRDRARGLVAPSA